jgi:hypothetical protein
MRNRRIWLYGVLLSTALGGWLAFHPSPGFAQPGAVRREERREERNYWRYHGGRWSHWDARDRRWYYTDGRHWYYHNGNRWDLYRFDKTFGREGFERGGYALPGPGVNVVVPNHEVYVLPR